MSIVLIHGKAETSEFALLKSLCHAAFRPDSVSLAPPPEGSFDWHRFLELAAYHRVEGLVARGLGAASLPVPAEVREQLTSAAQGIAAANLIMAQESARLDKAFAQAAIPLLFVKGLTLAAIAYGDLAAKSGADIDVLVEPQRIAESGALLSMLGYRPREPQDIVSLPAWHRRRKESLWIHDGSGAVIDLHSRLAESKRALPRLWPERPPRHVDIGYGVSLPTLDRDELAAYLAVHGVSSAWFRLKWIADFAAVIDREHVGRISELRKRMRTLGAHRMGDQALLLSDDLFGTLRDEPELRRSIEQRWTVRYANAIAHDYLSRAVEPTSIRGGTVGVHAAQLLLLEGTGARAVEFARKAALLIEGSAT